MRYFNYIYQDYLNLNKKKMLKDKLLNEHEYTIFKYVKLLRKEEFFFNSKHLTISSLYRRRKNKLGEKIGFTIPKNVFMKGLKIWHYGNIVISATSKIGENCILHGENCIGNKGKNAEVGSPIIGDNVDIGVGAKVLGNIYIGNGIVIAAGAVVVHSFYEEDIVLAGIPAVKIGKRVNKNEQK